MGDILATHGLNKPACFNDPRFGPLVVTSVLSTATAKANGAAASTASRLSEATSNKDLEAATIIIKDALAMKVADILRILPSEANPSLSM
jgi:zearalenone synthase (highly reducing iterative type I polyketide synthase)